MGLYEKVKKTIEDWKEGEHVLSRGKPMDDWRYGEYKPRDTIIIDGSKIMYKLWDTVIFTYDCAAKKIILNTGSYYTKTTKEKMNMMLSLLGINATVEGRYATRRTDAGDWIVAGTGGISPFVADKCTFTI